MSSQIISVHDGFFKQVLSDPKLGWLGAEKYRHVGRQVFAKECVGELRIAQHLFEKCVVDADDLTGHGMDVGRVSACEVSSHSNTRQGQGELL